MPVVMRADMWTISTAGILRLCIVAAFGLTAVNWWPRSTPPAQDGSIAWYHGIWGKRSYFCVTGRDPYGCDFVIDNVDVPCFSLMIGHYPDGSIRERTFVYVTGHVDGCTINRRRVRDGTYYAPNGSVIGSVQDATGNIMYCRPNGEPIVEYVIENGNLVAERNWFKNGTLQSERKYLGGKTHGLNSDYHPNGQLRSAANFENGLCVEFTCYDNAGNVLRFSNGN